MNRLRSVLPLAVVLSLGMLAATVVQGATSDKTPAAPPPAIVPVAEAPAAGPAEGSPADLAGDIFAGLVDKGIRAIFGAAKQRKLAAELAKAKIDPEQVIVGYLKHLSGQEQLSDQQRSEMRDLVESLAKDPAARSQAVTEALRSLSPELSEALVALADERTDVAVAKLLPLLKSDDPYLAADSSFFLARAYIQDERFEEALPLLKEITTSKLSGFTLNAPDALFLQGVTLGRLLDRTAAIQTLAAYLEQNPDAAERMRVGARQQLEELKLLEAGSLVDVEGRMDYSRRRLGLEKSDKPTQDQQARVIAMLDKLIKDAEDDENGGGGGGGKGKGKGKKKGHGRGRGGPGGISPGGGAIESSAQAGKAETGPLERIPRVGKGDDWGGLKNKERDEVLTALKAKFPDRYKQLVEQYYKSLQDEEP